MKEERFAIGGAVVTAIVASLCCIGPVLFAVLGFSAFGAASVFVAARRYLLAVAVLLLAVGFYWAYFRKPKGACAPGEACATQTVSRAGRVGLWFASFAVLAFALAPYYIGHLASALTQRQPPTTTTPATVPGAQPNADSQVQSNVETITVKVEGMSCSACEIPVRDALANVAGVHKVEVSYERGAARVEFDPQRTNVEQIKRAINSTGYEAGNP